MVFPKAGWVLLHQVIYKDPTALTLTTVRPCDTRAEQNNCSTVVYLNLLNIIRFPFLRLQRDGILYLIPEQSPLGPSPSDSALTPAF